jgi:N utilization substance protein B
MPSRRKSREHALQMLFIWDLNPQPAEETSAAFYDLVGQDAGPRLPRDGFADFLFASVVENASALDQHIARHAEHWKLERMAAVDRNILRLAVCEMWKMDTPPAVAIDEAIELARRYSNDEAPHFVNGVLDAVRRDLAATAGSSSG